MRLPDQQHLPADGFEDSHGFSIYANWIIPGHVMLGRYPYVEPSRCRYFFMPKQSSSSLYCLRAVSLSHDSVLLHADPTNVHALKLAVCLLQDT